jgi:hypothetical protein
VDFLIFFYGSVTEMGGIAHVLALMWCAASSGCGVELPAL